MNPLHLASDIVGEILNHMIVPVKVPDFDFVSNWTKKNISTSSVRLPNSYTVIYVKLLRANE